MGEQTPPTTTAGFDHEQQVVHGPQTNIDGSVDFVLSGTFARPVTIYARAALHATYENLRNYSDPCQVRETPDLQYFTGRKWLVEELDGFLQKDRGYFCLEATAGLGKTTFLAWLAKEREEREYVCHFCTLGEGERGVAKNLAAQIIRKRHLQAEEVEGIVSGTWPDDTWSLLRIAADRLKDNEKIVLVIDAVDELEAPPGPNVLGLPEVLPKGVFVILSYRLGARARLGLK